MLYQPTSGNLEIDRSTSAIDKSNNRGFQYPERLRFAERDLFTEDRLDLAKIARRFQAVVLPIVKYFAILTGSEDELCLRVP